MILRPTPLKALIERVVDRIWFMELAPGNRRPFGKQDGPSSPKKKWQILNHPTTAFHTGENELSPPISGPKRKVGSFPPLFSKMAFCTMSARPISVKHPEFCLQSALNADIK